MPIISHTEGNVTQLEGCKMVTTEIGGKKASKLWIEPGFDWRCVCKPILPGCPDWCPATHFGFIEKGCMKIQYEDPDRPDEVIKAGETYFVPPGHIPIIEGPETCVMVEFAESANKVYENIDKTAPPPGE